MRFGRGLSVKRLQASFRTQAGALMRKNAAFQRRNRRSNCCITVTPILFIMILFLIQKLVNSALDTPDTRVSGCTAAHFSHTHVSFAAAWHLVFHDQLKRS